MLNKYISEASNTHLAQGTVGLLIKELDLICSRAGLFVREAPGNLKRKAACLPSAVFLGFFFILA